MGGEKVWNGGIDGVEGRAIDDLALASHPTRFKFRISVRNHPMLGLSHGHMSGPPSEIRCLDGAGQLGQA